MFHVKHLFHALAEEAPPVKPTDSCRAETTAATQAAVPRVRGASREGLAWGARSSGGRPTRTSAEACGGGASRKRESPRGDPQAMKGASAEGQATGGHGKQAVEDREPQGPASAGPQAVRVSQRVASAEDHAGDRKPHKATTWGGSEPRGRRGGRPARTSAGDRGCGGQAARAPHRGRAAGPASRGRRCGRGRPQGRGAIGRCAWRLGRLHGERRLPPRGR